jgi:hypothetical protein
MLILAAGAALTIGMQVPASADTSYDGLSYAEPSTFDGRSFRA